MARRGGQSPDKPPLEEMEAPEGYEWYDKDALVLKHNECERLVQATEVYQHELDHINGDIEIPINARKKKISNDRSLVGAKPKHTGGE